MHFRQYAFRGTDDEGFKDSTDWHEHGPNVGRCECERECECECEDETLDSFLCLTVILDA